MFAPVTHSLGGHTGSNTCLGRVHLIAWRYLTWAAGGMLVISVLEVPAPCSCRQFLEY